MQMPLLLHLTPIGYPESLDYANKHNIALMLVVEIDNEFKLMFSNEWYNLGL